MHPTVLLWNPGGDFISSHQLLRPSGCLDHSGWFSLRSTWAPGSSSSPLSSVGTPSPLSRLLALRYAEIQRHHVLWWVWWPFLEHQQFGCHSWISYIQTSVATGSLTAIHLTGWALFRENTWWRRKDIQKKNRSWRNWAADKVLAVQSSAGAAFGGQRVGVLARAVLQTRCLRC